MLGQQIWRCHAPDAPEDDLRWFGGGVRSGMDTPRDSMVDGRGRLSGEYDLQDNQRSLQAASDSPVMTPNTRANPSTSDTFGELG
jgi:hypothetical protein